MKDCRRGFAGLVAYAGFVLLVGSVAFNVCGCSPVEDDDSKGEAGKASTIKTIGGVNFVEVDGESRLPLEFMWSGENRDKFETVRLPRYWIAEKPISKAVFARVMGKDGQVSEAPIDEIEWAEAETFCRCFTEMNRASLPTNCLVSLPTVSVLHVGCARRSDLSGCTVHRGRLWAWRVTPTQSRRLVSSVVLALETRACTGVC